MSQPAAAFVDEIIHVVHTRASPDAYAPIPTVAEFGKRVRASSGCSGLREFVTLGRTADVCTVNQGDAIAALGFPVDAFAGVGLPPDPVFEKIGPTTLRLNGDEANQIARDLGLVGTTHDASNTERLATQIREHAGISELGIHGIKSATGTTVEGAVTVGGTYCRTPKKNGGVGARFNAGCLAVALFDLPADERLMLGDAVFGFFVRVARSGAFPEILDFLRRWADGLPD